MPRMAALLGALALLALLLLPGAALGQTSIDVYNDFLEDGRLEGTYPDSVLESTISDASLFQYAPPLTVERLRRAARRALAGGSPPAPPAEPPASTPADGSSPGGASEDATGDAAAAGGSDEPSATGNRLGAGSAPGDRAPAGEDGDDLAALPEEPLIPPAAAGAGGDALNAASGGGSRDGGVGGGTIVLLVGGGILVLGGGLATMRLLGGRGVDGA